MFKKTLHITLAFLTLAVSSGITLNLHYCQGHLEKIALFSTPKSCHEPIKSCCASKQQKACHKGDNHDDNCCKNKSEFVKFDEQYTVKHEDANMDTRLPLVAVITVLVLNPLSTVESNSVDYLNYKPPLIERDISILFQSFLC